jgi:hypothetical protein
MTAGGNVYIGVELAGSTWYLLDGTPLGTGAPSNANPYAHWSNTFGSNLGLYPTYTCITMSSTFRYDLYLGDPTIYSQTTNATLYNTTATTAMYSWINVQCTGSYGAICELPMASYNCPPSPPTAPPPSPATSRCRPPRCKSIVAALQDCWNGTHADAHRHGPYSPPLLLRMHNMVCSPPADLPLNTSTVYCQDREGGSCYYYNSSYANYKTHKASCQARGGYLVAFNRCAAA